MQNFTMQLEELEVVTAPDGWDDFFGGFAAGIGVVAAIVVIT